MSARDDIRDAAKGAAKDAATDLAKQVGHRGFQLWMDSIARRRPKGLVAKLRRLLGGRLL